MTQPDPVRLHTRLAARVLSILSVSMLSAATVSTASGQFDSKRDRGSNEPRVRVELIAEAPAVVPGAPTEIGLLFHIKPGWHTYAPAQNDTGTPAMVEWSIEGAEGAVVSPLRWPAGERYIQPGDILDHVYEQRVLALATINIPSDASVGGAVTIRGDLEWLVCSAEMCLSEADEVELELPIAAAVRADPSPAWRSARRDWEAQRGMPVTGATNDDVAVSWDGPTLIVSTPHAARLSFVPLEDGAEVQGLLGRGASDEGRLTLVFEDADERPRVRGWIRLEPLSEDGPRPWSSEVWALDIAFGHPPARVVGTPSVVPVAPGG
ncbi:MAG: protein-disulfide reductase DsbD domain-containing protein [Phycisphaerales bacterium]